MKVTYFDQRASFEILLKLNRNMPTKDSTSDSLSASEITLEK